MKKLSVYLPALKASDAKLMQRRATKIKRAISIYSWGKSKNKNDFSESKRNKKWREIWNSKVIVTWQLSRECWKLIWSATFIGLLHSINCKMLMLLKTTLWRKKWVETIKLNHIYWKLTISKNRKWSRKNETSFCRYFGTKNIKM